MGFRVLGFTAAGGLVVALHGLGEARTEGRRGCRVPAGDDASCDYHRCVDVMRRDDPPLCVCSLCSHSRSFAPVPPITAMAA